MLKKKIGDPVNIETDLIAKYIEKLFMKERSAENNIASSSINMDMLERFGFGSNIK